MLKLLVYLCTQKYSTRGALGRFDGEVIRVKDTELSYERELSCNINCYKLSEQTVHINEHYE